MRDMDNTSPNICGTCAIWTRHDDKRMPQHGQCAKKSAGYYTHESNACSFNPILWKKKP